ncbi:hypothetical protein BaRGS_00020472 [Batillaria attramentaria]|uniref:Uncharacterized protein n=1 Tax=Batillaria attramentaria TaxID=370345 RepID=A0ABD0KMQ1_9CAEN
MTFFFFKCQQLGRHSSPFPERSRNTAIQDTGWPDWSRPHTCAVDESVVALLAARPVIQCDGDLPLLPTQRAGFSMAPIV